MKKISLFIIIGILFSPLIYINIDFVLADSNIYYVANSGSDSNNGLSLSTPWKTIGKVNTAMNTGTIITGDDICFKCGDTWEAQDTLDIKKGGTSDNWMVIGKYGTGPKPRFNNTGFAITISAANADYIKVEHFTLTNQSDGSSAVYVYNSHTNIHLYNLTIKDGWNGIQIKSTYYPTIENCTGENLANAGFFFYGSTGRQVSYGKMLNCTISSETEDFTNEDCFFIHDGESGEDVGINFLIENCVGSGALEQTIDINSGRNIVIKNCEGYTTGTHSISIANADVRNVTFINFYSHDNTKTSSGGIAAGDMNQLIVRNSVFSNDNHHALMIFCANATIFNNDFIYGADSATGQLCDFYENTENLIMKNNIILSLETSAPTRLVRYLNTGVNTTSTNSIWSNNIYYRGDNSSSLWQQNDATVTWKQWQALAETWNERKQNPLIDPVNDNWIPSAGSPCIDTGAFLTYTTNSGTGTTFTVDNARYFYDGYGLTDGDIIQVGTDKNLKIIEINYDTKQITVNRSFTRAVNDPVSFAYNGLEPDIGAYEFNQNANTYPLITNISLTTSNPLDTDPLYGWINITCNVIDDVEIQLSKLNITKTDGTYSNVTLQLYRANTYYFYASTIFSDPGNYSYRIWTRNINQNTQSSDLFNFYMAPNWDINKDGQITVLDLVLTSNRYNESGPLGWIREDVNNDGKVSVIDLVIASNHFGENWFI